MVTNLDKYQIVPFCGQCRKFMEVEDSETLKDGTVNDTYKCHHCGYEVILQITVDEDIDVKRMQKDSNFLNWLVVKHNDLYIKLRKEYAKEGQPKIE